MCALPLKVVNSKTFSRAFRALFQKYERECKVRIVQLTVDQDVKFYSYFQDFVKKYKFDLRQSKNEQHNSVRTSFQYGCMSAMSHACILSPQPIERVGGREAKKLLSAELRKNPDKKWPQLLGPALDRWNRESVNEAGVTPIKFFSDYERNVLNVWEKFKPHVRERKSAIAIAAKKRKFFRRKKKRRPIYIVYMVLKDAPKRPLKIRYWTRSCRHTRSRARELGNRSPDVSHRHWRLC